MKNIQEIFNVVIAEGFYQPNYLATHYSEYMCISLKYAENRGVITKEEMYEALESIATYLKEDLDGIEGLETLLIEHNLPSDFPARLKIYQDWENRPELFL